MAQSMRLLWPEYASGFWQPWIPAQRALSFNPVILLREE
jgi:hypothetical protein